MQKRLISWILALCMACSLALLPANAASNEQIIYNYLRTEMGCNEAVACGILANIEAECGFNPNAQSASYYGICQWSGSRLTALKRYCGENYTTLEGQLEYMNYELHNDESAAWAKLQGIPNTSDGAYTAGWNWAQYFERCASSQFAARGSTAANKFWPKYHGTAVSTPTPTPAAKQFQDVRADAYYADAVQWAVKQGVTQGTGKTTFSPDSKCTRAQMVTFLWRAKGSPDPKGTGTKFTDVPQNEYYYKAVLWAVEQGITQGTGKTTFSPGSTVSRAQTVTFLWRLAGSPAANGSGFGDVAVGSFYAPAVAWAVAQGITEGTGPSTFSPDAPCTRGQIVTFLYRDLK